jgi:hypothetical protein
MIYFNIYYAFTLAILSSSIVIMRSNPAGDSCLQRERVRTLDYGFSQHLDRNQSPLGGARAKFEIDNFVINTSSALAANSRNTFGLCK